MTIMIVEAKPVRVGKLAFRLRWAKDRSVIFTATAGSDTINIGSNKLSSDDRVWAVSDTTLPQPLTQNTRYFYVKVSDTSGKLAMNKGGSGIITMTDAGTGIHYLVAASDEAAADFGPLVVRGNLAGDKPTRKMRLNNAGIFQKVKLPADATDNTEVDIEGDEISIIFDDDSTAQTAWSNRTVMVIPTERDLSFLWQVDAAIADRKKLTQEDFGEFGRYLLKKCR